ncbi:hypothetical protein GH714_034675 [Hevea brasiliensis]|uniref:GDSL esterase/lipase n=1 Tax=Hevea brasiliensis TaxID=3981 RepID=A0A6A6MIU1_HEVBR|nr:hypothetical protein GH714_034675 [Hevea brasiliensis]
MVIPEEEMLRAKGISHKWHRADDELLVCVVVLWRTRVICYTWANTSDYVSSLVAVGGHSSQDTMMRQKTQWCVPTITLPNNEKGSSSICVWRFYSGYRQQQQYQNYRPVQLPSLWAGLRGCGKPTGRFSNGRVPSDFIVEAFGVKKLLPLILNPNLQLQDLLTGVTFASGGAGYDPVTSTLAPAFSLSDQIDQFKDYIKKINSAVGEEGSAAMVSKSVFIISIGSNDILNTYYSTPLRHFHYTIDSYADFLASSASSFIQDSKKQRRDAAAQEK